MSPQEIENWFIFIFILGLIGLSLLFGGCALSGRVYPRGDLAHQILRERTGVGLSNRQCTRYAGGVCQEESTLRYDLSDEGIRRQLLELGFVCKLGERRWEICADRVGYCRYSWDGWIFKKRLVEFIGVGEQVRLVQAGMRCFSKNVYEYPDM